MPLQNRVSPFGEILAIPQRGAFTGNRGIIHDPTTRRLLARRWSSRAWIICACDFKGRRREVMATRSWTELFFWDEATALAAGHRPCFFCRRADAVAFREAWAAGHQCSAPKASEMDAVLHRQRLDEHLRKRLHPPPMALSALPDGTMVADAGQSYLLLRGEILLWTEHGYRITHTPLSAPSLLTPPATVLALMSGYRPHIAAQNIPAPEPGSANDAH